MKAAKSSVGRAVDQPDAKIRFYLFSGPDEAQSRALAARLLDAVGAQKLAVSAGSIRANPAILADEAAALSLFGERRLVWIEPAGNEILEGVQLLLALDAVESGVVAIAGVLKSSPLLKLAETSPHALSFTAYMPEGDEAVRVVVALGRKVGLKMSPPVAARVAETCANDQAVVARELEKFALFIGASPQAPKELDHETIDALGAESTEGDFLHLADLALLGEVGELAGSVARLSNSGAEAVPALRSFQRRLLFLAPVRARVERGERIDAVMTSLGKSLFWKDKGPVERMLRSWSADDLATLAQRAGALERDLMLSDVPPREALGEELLAIARKARSLS